MDAYCVKHTFTISSILSDHERLQVSFKIEQAPTDHLLQQHKLSTLFII